MSLENQIKKLRTYFRKNGVIPTYEEMAHLFGYKSKSTSYYVVNKLIKAKYLRRDNKGNLIPEPDFLGLPYFQSSQKNPNERMSLDQYMVNKPSVTFLIRVKDDSMTGAGIFDGDIVVVERAHQASPGETIVVNLNNEFIIRKLAKKGHGYVLASANPKYPDLTLDRSTASALIGIIKGVTRKY